MSTEKGIGPFPHGSAVHMAVFTSLESYTGETTLEQGMLELVEELKTLRKALQQISLIEDRYNCGDWDEIEEARGIAKKALGK